MPPSDYFDSHYDVIAVGASLATLTAALLLAEAGKKVLVLEQHDSPGGVATSFVREGVEFEASLHEMMSIGTPECPCAARKFLESHGVNVEWIRLPHAYRLVTPSGSFEIHAGTNGDYSIPCREIADYCGDETAYEKLMAFFDLCARVHKASDLYAAGEIKDKGVFLHYREFIMTSDFTMKEMFDHFELPPLAQEILSAYWIYLGSPMEEVPFSVYGYLLADYLGHGAYIPRHTSYEMSMKLAMAAEKAGVTIEYSQPVERILVHKGKAKGVVLARGDELSCDFVLCGAYPNTVFGKMIDPKEVPEEARKWVNGMEVCVSAFSLVLLLDQDAKTLGLKDYATFYSSKPLDPLRVYAEAEKDGSWDFFTSVCVNVGHPDASPKGTCVYSITYLPRPESFRDVTPETYEEYKTRHAEELLSIESKRLGIDLKAHLLQMIIETPLSIAHYTGAYGGAIYGYRHKMDTHVISRTFRQKKESFIEGLTFCGAHQAGGDGMAPAIMNGRAAARHILRKGAKK